MTKCTSSRSGSFVTWNSHEPGVCWYVPSNRQNTKLRKSKKGNTVLFGCSQHWEPYHCILTVAFRFTFQQAAHWHMLREQQIRPFLASKTVYDHVCIAQPVRSRSAFTSYQVWFINNTRHSYQRYKSSTELVRPLSRRHDDRYVPCIDCVTSYDLMGMVWVNCNCLCFSVLRTYSRMLTCKYNFI